MKTEWERTTRICATIDLSPDLLAALRAHIEEREFGAVEAQALVCFENVSHRTKKAGLLMRMTGSGHTTLTQAVLVTPARLIWAQRTDDDDAFATSELLGKLEIVDYERTPDAQIMPDHGIMVSGIAAGAGHVGSLFFGMGEGPDADRARRVVKDAARAAHGEGPAVA